MYLIIGANGYLGSYIIKNILDSTTENIVATARTLPNGYINKRVKWIQLDITDNLSINKMSVLSSSYEKIKVVYLAAYHKPDLVQKNPRVAWNVNVIALAKVLNTLENVECFFYSSTDSVYGESQNGYHFKENDVLNPVNTYGIQKKTAEALVNGFGYNVVRFPFLIGRSILKQKKHFFDTIYETLAQNDKMEMFYDSFRSALDFDTVSDILVSLMETYRKTYPKIVNISGDEDLSKYDIGIMLAKQYGFDTKLVSPISIKENKAIFETPRAGSTLMDNTLIKSVLGVQKIVIKL